MTENECNILSNMPRADFREFRGLVIDMVLHTGLCFLDIFPSRNFQLFPPDFLADTVVKDLAGGNPDKIFQTCLRS